MGTVRDLRTVNITDIAPAEEVTIGADTWIVMPLLQKGSGANTSGNQGYAYKKII